MKRVLTPRCSGSEPFHTSLRGARCERGSQGTRLPSGLSENKTETPTVGCQEDGCCAREHCRSHPDAGCQGAFARITVTTATFCNKLPLKLSRVYASYLRGSAKRLCHRGQQARVQKSRWRRWLGRSATPSPLARSTRSLSARAGLRKNQSIDRRMQHTHSSFDSLGQTWRQSVKSGCVRDATVPSPRA